MKQGAFSFGCIRFYVAAKRQGCFTHCVRRDKVVLALH